MEELRDIWLGAGGSLLAMVLAWCINKGFGRAKLRARVKDEAHAAWKRHAASSIKGDGFSALFHLHRALHVRMRSLAWCLAAGFCVVLAMMCGRWLWVAGGFLLALQYCVFRVSYLSAQAAVMVEVAEEAITEDSKDPKTEIVKKQLE